MSSQERCFPLTDADQANTKACIVGMNHQKTDTKLKNNNNNNYSRKISVGLVYWFNCWESDKDDVLQMECHFLLC